MAISELELELRDALGHLYDPGFQPSLKLCEYFGVTAIESGVAVQCKVTETIESLKPQPGGPATTRPARYYEILHNRFVMRLTLEETALRMHMSLSSTWREQRAAIHMLATELWRRNSSRTDVPEHHESELPGQGKNDLVDPIPDHQSQTRLELAALLSQAPDANSEVAVLVQQVVELESGLSAKRGVALEVGPIKSDLIAAVHPSVFRQILIISIGTFLRQMNGGKISLFGRLEDGEVKITISGAIGPEAENFAETLTRELPLPDGSSAEVYREGQRVFLWVKLPSLSERVNVLVVDDNLDMVHYYQRSTEGTPYHVIPIEADLDLFAAIQKSKPDLIVLDVMLPNVDGWELLMRIRASVLTRSIPVIICSVVKEEELALSLGAALFISKPVSPQNFVHSLDRVLAQTP